MNQTKCTKCKATMTVTNWQKYGDICYTCFANKAYAVSRK